MTKNKKFLIIDANALVHRAFHALPPLKTKSGRLVNAVYGFLLIFFKALKDIQPDFIAVCFDAGKETFRHKIFTDYKAKRQKAPDELYSQINDIKKFLQALAVPCFEKKGFEADDLIATIAKEASQSQASAKLETVILTGDMDALQLVDEQTKVYALKKGLKETMLYGLKETKEKYGGLLPNQLTDFRALRGDPSDNIPGVKGIGQKTAEELLKEFGSLEKIYQLIGQDSSELGRFSKSVLTKLKNNKEQAFLSQRLAQLDSQSPIDFKLKESAFGPYQSQPMINLLKEYGFNSLLNKLPLKEAGGREQVKLNLDQGEKTVLREIENLQKEGALSPVIAQLEKKLVPVVAQMEKHGIRAEKKCLERLSLGLAEEIKLLEKKIYRLAQAKFNLNSPQQLQEALFEKLGVSSEGVKKTPGGALSTGASELAKLKKRHPVVSLILRYRALFKLKTGFVDVLPAMISPADGRIHARFHQLGAETGRMSCSQPNLQNIPVKSAWGGQIRKCFKPQDGFLFLSADYSQVDLRVAASLSGDQKMIDFFKQGKDIHQMTASALFETSESKVTPGQRKLAKTLNFGVLYGMGPRKLAENANLSFDQARDFIDQYFINFKDLAGYLEEIVNKAREQGFSQTLLGRKRFLPEINSRDQRLRAQAERIAKNLPVQGTVADIMKLVMVELKEKKVLSEDCRLISQIHDELLFEIKEEALKEKAQEIKKIMETKVKLKTSLKVDLQAGRSWGQLETF